MTGGTVHVELLGDGLLVTLDHGPVNAINSELRIRALEVLDNVDDARFVVLRGQGGYFSAGADVTEIGTALEGPPIRDLLHRIEALECPVVAFVDGIALGGGFEIALACDYRVATEHARFGLPEIRLGLVPGAGGTVRLPRLVGPGKALSLIATGRTIDVDEALEAGVVDWVSQRATAEADLLRWFESERPKRRIFFRDAALDSAEGEAFTQIAAKLRAKASNKRAFDVCVDLVRANLTLPPDECEAREAAAFEKLMSSSESSAQRYLFAATSAVKRYNRQLRGVAARTDRVGVVGAGTMGLGIARAALQTGLPVTIVEPYDDARERAQDLLAKLASKNQARAGARTLALPTWSSALDDLADCDVVIEAVFEDLDVKRDVFASLTQVTRPDAVLASNTSYIEIERIAVEVAHPERVLGMHFFSPAHAMALVEVVRAAQTGGDALRTAVELALRLGKIPVVVGSSYGFVGNRMLARRSVQADGLLLSGARPDQVDRVLTTFGFPMGPYAMADLVGLDVSWRHRQANRISAPAADRLVAAGRFGRKVGRGFYSYLNGAPETDREVEQLVEEVAVELGVERRELSDHEILDRLLLPLVDEAVQIVQERVVARSTDIDVIWANGYGWPGVQGGPMFWGKRRGLRAVVRRLDELAEVTNDASLRASDVLREWSEGDPSVAPTEGS